MFNLLYSFISSVLFYYFSKYYLDIIHINRVSNIELESKIKIFNTANNNLNHLININNTLKKQYEEVINYHLFSDS